MEGNKKKFKDTKFGQFLTKASESIPEILTVGGSILTGNIGGAVESVGDILKEKALKDERARELYKEFELAKMTFEKELYELEVEDRKSARVREVEMAKSGKTDWMMYATGLTALGSFLLIVISVIFIPETQTNKLFIHLMGMVEGVAITVFMYYFGSSKGSKDKDAKINNLL